jgi:hypothetical protein
MRSLLSVRGQAKPVLGEPLRYRTSATAYDSSMLGVELGEIMHGIDWCTVDPDTGGRMLHTLFVPRAVMTDFGLDRLDGFEALVEGRLLQFVGRPHGPIKDESIAVALGLPPGTSLDRHFQRLMDGSRPMAMETVYAEWLRGT